MTQPFTIEKHADEAAWKAARLQGVGASEAAAVCRISKWCSPFALYFRKLEGRVEDDDDDGGNMAEWGKRHESALAKWFLEQAGEHGMHMMHDPGDFTIFRSSERQHVFATLDRQVRGDLTDETGDWRPLELKCAWYDAAKEWKERVPIAYRIQAQQQMYVTGTSECYFAVLLNGCEAKWFRELRHDKWIARMLRLIDEFWERVQHRQPPPPDGHKADFARLLQLYPETKPDALELPAELQDAGAEWDKITAREKEIAEKKDKLKAQLQFAMGERSLARCADGSGFSWPIAGKSRRFCRVARVGDQQ